MVQQLLGRFGIELLIGAQEMQEIGKPGFPAAALEAAGVDHRFHLGADARHLVQADLVDLCRAQVQRGVLADLRAVERLTAGHRLGRQAGARLRHILVLEKGQQLAVGRDHATGDRRLPLALQLLALGLRDRGRQTLQRAVQRRGGRILQPGHRGNGHLAPVQHRAWHAEATRQAGTHIVDLLPEMPWHILQQGDVILRLLRRGQRPACHEAEVGPERGVRIERHLVAALLDRVDQVQDLRAVYRVVDLALGRELGGIDAVQLGQHLLPAGQPGLLGCLADIFQPVAGTLLAWRIGMPPLVLGIGNRAQAQVGGIGGGRTRITRGRCR